MASLFPTIGSKVVNVQTTKTGTAARIEFDDGSSLYVKYEALVTAIPSSQVSSVRAPSSGGRMSESFAPKKVKKTEIKSTRIPQSVLERQQTFSMDPQQQQLIMAEKAKMALERCQSRQERLMEQWDRENPSGETSFSH